jgi:hypothetical protein
MDVTAVFLAGRAVPVAGRSVSVHVRAVYLAGRIVFGGAINAERRAVSTDSRLSRAIPVDSTGVLVAT